MFTEQQRGGSCQSQPKPGGSWSCAQPVFYKEKMSHIKVSWQSESPRCILAPSSETLLPPLLPAAPQPLTDTRLAQPPATFLVSALGRVPNCGSVGLSTGLLISEGTDSVLLIFVTEKQVGEGRLKLSSGFFILVMPPTPLKG